MPDLRIIKRKARRDLHSRMRVPCVHLADGDIATAVNTFCRLHTKFVLVGLGAGQAATSQMHENVPKILFMISEMEDAGIVLKRHDVISVAPGEAFQLDAKMPEDDITVTWVVTELSASKAAGLPVPE